MSQEQQEIIQIDPRELQPHPENPRGRIDPTDPEVVALAENFASHGIIQPLVILPNMLIIAGHRRQAAAILAGMVTVPAIVRTMQPGELPEDIFLSENVQRQSLSPLEEAKTLAAVARKLEKQTKRTVSTAELARRFSMPVATVRERLAILKLSERVQKLFHLRELPIRSSTQLTRLLEWPDEIEAFADRMVSRRVTFAALDALITRRIAVLDKEKAAKAKLARDERLSRIAHHYPENRHTPSLTRESVSENLKKDLRGNVSLFNVDLIFEQTCCACGMAGEVSICLTCPLPKFVNGLIGRSTRGGGDDE